MFNGLYFLYPSHASAIRFGSTAHVLFRYPALTPHQPPQQSLWVLFRKRKCFIFLTIHPGPNPSLPKVCPNPCLTQMGSISMLALETPPCPFQLSQSLQSSIMELIFQWQLPHLLHVIPKSPMHIVMNICPRQRISPASRLRHCLYHLQDLSHPKPWRFPKWTNTQTGADRHSHFWTTIPVPHFLTYWEHLTILWDTQR